MKNIFTKITMVLAIENALLIIGAPCLVHLLGSFLWLLISFRKGLDLAQARRNSFKVGLARTSKVEKFFKGSLY